jgi:hypothetical protein
MIDQPLMNLVDAFRTDASDLVKARVNVPETIELASDIGDVEFGDSQPQFGYWLLTTERLFRVRFTARRNWSSNRPLARAWFESRSERKVALPPPSALSKDEFMSRRVTESYLDRFVEINWERLISRDWAGLCNVTIRALPDDTISAVMFSECDALAFCERISAVVRGRAAPNAVAGDDLRGVPALFQALRQLRDAGLLSEDEFTAKKRALLDRI